MTVKAVFCEGLSTPGNPRYILIDADTGEVLDDAQGYGYKTQRKAHAAYSYKTLSAEQRRQKAVVRRKVRDWLERRPQIQDQLLSLALRAELDHRTLENADVQNLLAQFGYRQLDFGIEDLLEYF